MVMIDVLAGLFGSKARVRLLRLFCFNPTLALSSSAIAERAQCAADDVRRELRVLERIGFVKARRVKNRKVYSANEDFVLRGALIDLLMRATVTAECAALQGVARIGEVHLALASGIFLNYTKARADVFIVANNVSRARLQRWIAALEAEVGREVRYVLMNLDEYKYRLNMTDRFLRDFFHGPYDEIINTIPHFKRSLRALARHGS